MNAKHTPGPWAYRHASGCVEAVGDTRMMICQEYAIGTGPNGELSPSQEAFHNGNAQLIAAAPDLLAALEQWQKVREEMGDAVKGTYRVRWEVVRDMDVLADAARATIAKAKGGAA